MNLARLALVISALSAPVAAQDYHVGQIAITRPVLRVASPVSKTGAGYMTISNSGSRPDRLIAVITVAAARSDMHGSFAQGTIVQMRAQAGGVPIPAGGRVQFAPGGLHVMFIGLRAAVPVGTKVPAKLVFARAGRVDVVFTAQGFAAP